MNLRQYSSGYARIGVLAATAGAVCVFAAPAFSQDRNIRTLTRYQVKPDRYDDFVDLVRHYADLNRKVGAALGFTVWQSLSGPREFVISSSYAKWADLDLPRDPKLNPDSADAARARARFTATVENQERIIDQVLPFSFGNRADPPKMLRSVGSTVRPDKVTEYIDLIRTELAPALKKSGARTYLVGRTRFGGPNNLIRSATAVETWGEMDDASYLAKALGDEGARKFLAKVSTLTLRTEVNMYRYRADMSYLPSAGN